MSDIVIQIDRLGKKYTIGHETKQERYTALRDVFSRMTRTALRKTVDLVRGRPIVDGDQLEEVWALRDVNFEIRQGSVVGIIGRNGAGKSTLLKILSRITEPSTGRAIVKGRVASLLEVGTGFHPELTGRENIYLNGAILGMTRREIRKSFDEIVAFAEVERFLDTPVKRYSSGMYVRLAFAVAAHLETDILIVDEVLAVGDAAFQKKCLGKMKQVTEKGRTVLFVSHNMGAVSTLCDLAVHLDEGTVRAIGPVEEIVSCYLGPLLRPDATDLVRLRMEGFGKKIRITDIRLVGDQSGNLLYGDPMTFRMSVKAEAKMVDVSVGSSIFAEDGVCVGTLFTEDMFSIGANEELRLELRIVNSRLAPGSYYAGFSLGTGGLDGPRTDQDIIIGTPYFNVIPGSTTRYAVANWHGSHWGHVVLGETCLTIG
jgi:lipopolysaccharide transport system ATP-binding protein